MGAALIANLPAKTGPTVDEWIASARAAGVRKDKASVNRLKQEHGLGHVTAEHILYLANRRPDEVDPTPEELFEAQYAGSKAGLRPIYDRIQTMVSGFGDDV